MKLRSLLLSLLFVSTCTSRMAIAADLVVRTGVLPLAEAGFGLRLPQSELVAFHGVVSYDKAGPPGGPILYPAPGIAGLLVAIATHGGIVEAAKSSEKEKLRQTADKVLEPYREVLEKFSNADLMRGAVTELPVAGEKAVLITNDGAYPGWVVASSPVFWLAQDQSSLVLENMIEVYSAPGKIQYQNTVKVVSNASSDPNLAQMWLAENGKRLKQQSIDMFAHSLKMVLDELAKPPGRGDEVQKTFRYSEGKLQKIERAQLIEDLCDRLIVRTLRGWLLSIPQNMPDGPETPGRCKAQISKVAPSSAD